MNLLNAYANGALRLEQLYVELFGVIPNSYLYYKEGLFFKTSYLTSEKCEEIFGKNIDVMIHEEEKIYTTSKADDDWEESTTWDDLTQSFKKRNQPFIVIVHHDKKWILSIDENSIKVYSYKFDYKAFVQSILEWMPQQDKVDKTATIDLVAYDRNYYTINSKIKRTVINLDSHYNDDLKEMDKTLRDFLGEQESGLAVIHGSPGTGKSFYIRHLLSTMDKKFILVTNAIAAHMAEPEFIAFMMENKDSIFILEDCEQILMAREENRFGGAIANILNISDGLMSDIFNIKFICTFNTDIENIDEALLRPGRCFINYEFKSLCEKKSVKLLESLGHKIDKPKEMTLAEIYNYKEEEDKPIQKPRKIGF
jgi:hypothetical protein